MHIPFQDRRFKNLTLGSSEWFAAQRSLVNDKPADNLSTTEIADLLKGPRGTQVKITVIREGAAEPISFTVTRDEVKRPSVQEAF